MLAFLALGALAAGFVNGFAGFGTALVASGFWFLVLPAEIVPPLIIVCAVAGQLLGLWKLAGTLSWRKSDYLVSGGVFGVPLGTALLTILSPTTVKAVIGAFLIVYSVTQLKGLPKFREEPHQDGLMDRLVGFVGGIFGGFSGLSGPVPLVWFQLNKLPSTEQRARYQPYNLLILCLAAIAMAGIGKLDAQLLSYAAVAVPFTLVGAAIGVKAFLGISEQAFQRSVLLLLFASGSIIVAQTALL